MRDRLMGWTLVESLIVAAIVLILLAVLGPYLMGYECVRYERQWQIGYHNINGNLYPYNYEANVCVEWRKREPEKEQ